MILIEVFKMGLQDKNIKSKKVYFLPSDIAKLARTSGKKQYLSNKN